MSSPPPAEPTPPDLIGRLQAASAGLLYSSESDRPFEVFFRPAADVPDALDAEGFARLVEAGPDEPFEEWSIDRFFAPHIDCVDPADQLAWERLPRYDALRTLLQRELRGLRVFRVGSVLIRCFAVGHDDAGNLVGLETLAVET